MQSHAYRRFTYHGGVRQIEVGGREGSEDRAEQRGSERTKRKSVSYEQMCAIIHFICSPTLSVHGN